MPQQVQQQQNQEVGWPTDTLVVPPEDLCEFSFRVCQPQSFVKSVSCQVFFYFESKITKEIDLQLKWNLDKPCSALRKAWCEQLGSA